jgi:uncharacterized iron-regulated membrane protein
MTFRKTVFWLHLGAGVTAGLVIAIMAFTGVTLAFEQPIVAWVECDARTVAPPPAGAARLPLARLVQRVQAAAPGVQPSTLVVSADPGRAVAVTAGRESVYYINPYTGAVHPPGARRTRAFLHTMEMWHRWLGGEGPSRTVGRAVTGACNAAFLVLALTGLYLWWPRSWSWRGLRAIAFPDVRLAGKARDWNWHNSTGFWCAPVLVVLTATGMVMSYSWANHLVYRAAGETPPVRRAPGAVGAGAIPAPAGGARPLGYDALLALVEHEAPAWKEITLRLAGPSRSPGARDSAAARPRAKTSLALPASPPKTRTVVAQPVTFTLRERKAWPAFARTTLTLDPFTGAVLSRQGFADLSPGRRARSWIRFLHTGEALGWPGQLVAGLASLGGGILVWTGLALAFRRFFGRNRTRSSGIGAGPRPAVFSRESENN